MLYNCKLSIFEHQHCWCVQFDDICPGLVKLFQPNAKRNSYFVICIGSATAYYELEAYITLTVTKRGVNILLIGTHIFLYRKK